MKTISVVTLLFLPTTTVGTIFGTQFFKFGDASDIRTDFRVSRWIWLLALFSVSLTLIVTISHIGIMRHKASQGKGHGRRLLQGKPWNVFYGKTAPSGPDVLLQSHVAGVRAVGSYPFETSDQP